MPLDHIHLEPDHAAETRKIGLQACASGLVNIHDIWVAGKPLDASGLMAQSKGDWARLANSGRQHRYGCPGSFIGFPATLDPGSGTG
jgi:hypothetical protein